MGLKVQTFAYFVYIASCTVSRCLGPWYRDFFNVESVKTDNMNSSKRQTTPWTKSSILPQSLFDGVRLRLENFPRILLRALRGVRTLSFIGRRHDPVDSCFDEVR